MFKELVEKMAKAVANDPDQVKVTQTFSDNTVILELEVAKDDLGHVIGKQGKYAKAMRTILIAAAAHSTKRVMLEIAD